MTKVTIVDVLMSDDFHINHRFYHVYVLVYCLNRQIHQACFRSKQTKSRLDLKSMLTTTFNEDGKGLWMYHEDEWKIRSHGCRYPKYIKMGLNGVMSRIVYSAFMGSSEWECVRTIYHLHNGEQPLYTMALFLSRGFLKCCVRINIIVRRNSCDLRNEDMYAIPEFACLKRVCDGRNVHLDVKTECLL